jgi:hypothetical protein
VTATATRARRVRTVVAFVALSLAGATTALAAAPPPSRTAAAPATPCHYPDGVPADRWSVVRRAPAATSAVHQLDQDPCVLLVTDKDGKRWRSADAGLTWAAAPGPVATTRVLTEGLQPRAGARVIGPVLAVGPVPGDQSGVPQVYASDDDGVTFEPARLGLTVDTPLGPVAQQTPLRMDVAGATTAVHYENGRPLPYVYVAGRARTSALPDLPAGTASALLKSTDGGHTFRVLQSPQRVTPTVIAVNPTSQDEIWVNDLQQGSPGGGAWVSYDGGETFATACCADATVYDIAIGAAPDGGIVVLLATDKGLLRSADDGKTWATVGSGGKVYGVRMPADDPNTLVVRSELGIELSTGPVVSFKPLPGLPAGCVPANLRRDDRVPSTFLVDCGDGRVTYRLLLTKYAGADAGGDGNPDPVPLPDTDPVTKATRPLMQLTTWSLPGSNSATGTIAFDGRDVYYDMNTPGDIGVVRASDGAFLGVLHTDLPIVSLTADLRRNGLVVTAATGDLVFVDLATRRARRIGSPPTKVPSYDASSDGLSWVPEYGVTLFRSPRTGGPGRAVCSVSETLATVPSTWVAAGDGGGYLQTEDDATVYRISKDCRVAGAFSHRVFSESTAENDAMACDTQTYFPQPAIWIRDSQPQTVTAYGVPFGYCPMPSDLALRSPRVLYAGSVTSLCADLTNATTHVPARDRGVAVTAAGAVVGHGQTDADGRVCVPYTAPAGINGKTDVTVVAAFAGDSALYPTSTTTTVTVLDGQPVPPVPRQPAVLAAPPPPYAPAVPPNPIPNPGPAGGPVQAPAPNPAPAGQMQAQSQPVAQGAVAPQRQQQPQLALAHAANQIEVEGNAMVAPARRRRLPVDAPVVAALLGMCCVVTAGCARTAAAVARTRPAPPRRSR